MPHPYHWMTIGSQEDLDAASLEDVQNFFRRFYGPSNASLALAGDFQRDEALDMVNRYFGDLPPGPPLPRMGRHDSSLAGRVELEVRGQSLSATALHLLAYASRHGHLRRSAGRVAGSVG